MQTGKLPSGRRGEGACRVLDQQRGGVRSCAMASLQGWWVRETFLRAIEVASPPALAGLAAGAVYRSLTAPLSRMRFLLIHDKLLAITPKGARARYVLMNRTPKLWPERVLAAKPMLGASVPFAFISSASYAFYVGGKRLWISAEDSVRDQTLKSVALGAAAGQLTRLFFVTKPHYRMVLPAPYLATALPLYDHLRPNYSIYVTSLVSAIAGSFADGVIGRMSARFVYMVRSRISPATQPPPRFKTVTEMLLWSGMHVTRAIPRALLLGSLDFFLTLLEPLGHHARSYLTPPVKARRPAPPAAGQPGPVDPGRPTELKHATGATDPSGTESSQGLGPSPPG